MADLHPLGGNHHHPHQNLQLAGAQGHASSELVVYSIHVSGHVMTITRHVLWNGRFRCTGLVRGFRVTLRTFRFWQEIL